MRRLLAAALSLWVARWLVLELAALLAHHVPRRRHPRSFG